jgi:hypothetical protein
MHISFSFNNRFLILFTSCVCLFSGTLLEDRVISQDDIEVQLPLFVRSNEELLDQIFEEGKSDRLCRFIKTKKLKV